MKFCFTPDIGSGLGYIWGQEKSCHGFRVYYSRLWTLIPKQKETFYVKWLNGFWNGKFLHTILNGATQLAMLVLKV